MSTSVDSHPGGVTDFVHVGLVVEDLDETVRFLGLLGLDCSEPGVFSGEWIDRIVGLEEVTVEIVMARAPDGNDMFEVVRFQSPSAGAHELTPAANRPGLRHVAFKVDDVRGVVDRIREAGWETVGEIVDFESTDPGWAEIVGQRLDHAREAREEPVGNWEPRERHAVIDARGELRAGCRAPGCDRRSRPA